ncbi:MAG: cobalamin biosynthesis protein CbiX [Roseovarius sp.]|uniref:sirohydrochlorin chelatase n=1 Tax=Roseovarius sp. TaxID=1486281 RepID=UPI001B4D3C39|nr:CbiX/SirB N-terminal domain-containing protein [Roseovarius sp.]MBQ0748608.1 cobalamin biosynthesis protein CbiX [Roseovarius sp.]MBQ0811148.1 cobalamin biosynthesis protein CbiX [Roseovarius sp.]
MSATRSRSGKKPILNPAALIVSHGQPSDPDPAEAVLAGFAAEVARALPGWQVGSATLAKPGALEAALADAGPGAHVYPYFMTGGWFTGEALIERLAGAQAVVLPPFGHDPGLPGMAAALLSEVMAAQGWQAPEVRVFLAAHGSGRSAQAAIDSQGFAAALAAALPVAEVRVGFVEEPPYLADQARDLGARAICLPFFAAKGGHVTEDIPKALELAGFQGVLLDPIGCAPGAAALVARGLKREPGPA